MLCVSVELYLYAYFACYVCIVEADRFWINMKSENTEIGKHRGSYEIMKPHTGWESQFHVELQYKFFLKKQNLGIHFVICELNAAHGLLHPRYMRAPFGIGKKDERN